MKHATVNLGEYVVPLIGVPASATREKCDGCRKQRHLSAVFIQPDGRTFLCTGCLMRRAIRRAARYVK